MFCSRPRRETCGSSTLATSHPLSGLATKVPFHSRSYQKNGCPQSEDSHRSRTMAVCIKATDALRHAANVGCWNRSRTWHDRRAFVHQVTPRIIHNRNANGYPQKCNATKPEQSQVQLKLSSKPGHRRARATRHPDGSKKSQCGYNSSQRVLRTCEQGIGSRDTLREPVPIGPRNAGAHDTGNDEHRRQNDGPKS